MSEILQPLDDFCKVIKPEIDRVLLQRPIEAEEWIFSTTNRPFAPQCSMNAKELSERPSEYLAGIFSLSHRSNGRLSPYQ